MSEVVVKLAELRNAAERLNRAGRQVDESVQTVCRMIDEAVAFGLTDLALVGYFYRYHHQRGLMMTWSDQLLDFSIKLDQAADELERAVYDRVRNRDVGGPYTTMYPGGGASFTRSRTLIKEMLESDSSLWPEDEEETPDPLPIKLKDYVSGVNRPLYEQLSRDQETLKIQRGHLSDLLQTRQDAVEDLTDLKNRLTSYNPSVDLSTVPRVQALEAEIASLDQQIISSEQAVVELQTNVDDLTVRLERVKPGLNADVRVITELENSVTSDWIKGNTYDCVNYIADRMPIPGNIARNAYLWDDTAAQFQEFGVTSGDEPLVGSVIVMEREHAYADDVFGHLLYVEQVENGEIWVTDYLNVDTPVKLSDLTDELTGPNIKFLYFPWHTQA